MSVDFDWNQDACPDFCIYMCRPATLTKHQYLVPWEWEQVGITQDTLTETQDFPYVKTTKRALLVGVCCGMVKYDLRSRWRNRKLLRCQNTGQWFEILTDRIAVRIQDARNTCTPCRIMSNCQTRSNFCFTRRKSTTSPQWCQSLLCKYTFPIQISEKGCVYSHCLCEFDLTLLHCDIDESMD